MRILTPLLTLLTLSAALSAQNVSMTPFHAHDKQTFEHLTLLDSKTLHLPHGVSELSALHIEANRLFALSDEGVLHQFTLTLGANHIASLHYEQAVVIHDSNNNVEHFDSEGLASCKHHTLLVSLEKRPRVVKMSQKGEIMATMPLPKALRNKRAYHGKNKMLEALAYHHRYGIITAPEEPFDTTQALHHLYAMQQQWHIPYHGALTGLAFIEENILLILERRYEPLRSLHTITISRLDITTNHYTLLLVMDERKGWHLDNFEGIAAIDAKRFIIVSDDNDSRFQKTLLFLFALHE